MAQDHGGGSMVRYIYEFHVPNTKNRAVVAMGPMSQLASTLRAAGQRLDRKRCAGFSFDAMVGALAEL